MEPNNSFSVATKTELSIPLAFDGVIQEDGDIDCFRFQAKKGDRYYIKAHARSVASPLDPVLNLYYGDGKSIRGNDDASNGPDSLITQTFPRDGEYILRITDHLGRGSPLHAYRIETEKLEPEIKRLPVKLWVSSIVSPKIVEPLLNKIEAETNSVLNSCAVIEPCTVKFFGIVALPLLSNDI